ncbi:MAG: hypothetical protein K6G36_00450 [Candidatus Saccharibacteria bacterium]|nr:hypothetical protein [Candidatus Saccharibacteria bacterium]
MSRSNVGAFKAYLKALSRFHPDVGRSEKDECDVIVETRNEDALKTLDDMLEQLHIGFVIERGESRVVVNFNDPATAEAFCKEF